MSNINLLDWRQELIARQKKTFINYLIFSAILGALVCAAAYFTFEGLKDAQTSKNQFLTTEIKKVEEQIREIEKLKQYRQSLIDRMNAIDTLQQNRNIAVHLFSDLPNLTATGLYLNNMNFKDRVVGIKGLAESNPRVSSMLRNIENSKWLGQGAIGQTKAEVKDGKKIVPTLPDGLYDFDMSFRVLNSADANNADAKNGGK